MAICYPAPADFHWLPEVTQLCGHKTTLTCSDKDRALLAKRNCKHCWIQKRKKADAAIMSHALRMSINCAELDGTMPQRDWATLIRYRTLASLRLATPPSGLEDEWRRAFAIAKAINSSKWWIKWRKFLLKDPRRAFEAIAHSSGESVMMLAAARMRANLRSRLPIINEELERAWGKIEQI